MLYVLYNNTLHVIIPETVFQSQTESQTNLLQATARNSLTFHVLFLLFWLIYCFIFHNQHSKRLHVCVALIIVLEIFKLFVVCSVNKLIQKIIQVGELGKL